MEVLPLLSPSVAGAGGANKIKLGTVFEETMKKEEEEKWQRFEEERRRKANRRRRKLEAVRRKAKQQLMQHQLQQQQQSATSDVVHTTSRSGDELERSSDMVDAEWQGDADDDGLAVADAVMTSSSEDSSAAKRGLSTAAQRRQRRWRGKEAKRQRMLEKKQRLEAEQKLAQQQLLAEQKLERQRLAELADAQRRAEEARQAARREAHQRIFDHLTEVDSAVVMHYWPCVRGRLGETEEELAEVVAKRREAEEEERRRLQAEAAERERVRREREEEEHRERERVRREEEEVKEKARMEEEAAVALEETKRLARERLEMFAARRAQRAASLFERAAPLSVAGKRRERRRRARERSLSVDAYPEGFPVPPVVHTTLAAAAMKLAEPKPAPSSPTPTSASKERTEPVRVDETEEEREARIKAREEELRRKKRERRNQKRIRSRASSMSVEVTAVEAFGFRWAQPSVMSEDSIDRIEEGDATPDQVESAEVEAVMGELSKTVSAEAASEEKEEVSAVPESKSSIDEEARPLILSDEEAASVLDQAEVVASTVDAMDVTVEEVADLPVEVVTTLEQAGTPVCGDEEVHDSDEPPAVETALDSQPQTASADDCSKDEADARSAVESDALLREPSEKKVGSFVVGRERSHTIERRGSVTEEAVRMRVLYDYTPDADAPGELELLAGDIVLVYLQDQREGDPWWFGEAELDGRCGYFPESFVEPASAGDALSQDEYEDEDEAGVEAEDAHEMLPTAAPQHGDHQDGSRADRSSSSSSKASPQPSSSSSPSPPTVATQPAVAPRPSPTDPEWPRGLVTYDWKATAPDEMDLHLGEVIDIYEQDPSGWWTGAFGEKRYGLFPSRFVNVLSKEQARRLNSVTNVKQKVMEMVGVELAEKQKDDDARRHALREWKTKLDSNISASSNNSSGSVAAALANRKKQRESAKQHKPGADKEETVSKKVSPTKKAGSRIIKLLGKSKEEVNSAGEEPLPSPKRRSASLSGPPRQQVEPRAPPVPAAAKTRSGSISVSAAAAASASASSSSLIGPMMKKKTTGSLVELSTTGRDFGDGSTSPTTERKKRGSWLLGRAVDAPEQPKSPVLVRRWEGQAARRPFQKARVVQDYLPDAASSENSLRLRKNEVVLVLIKNAASGLWTGHCEGDPARCGTFPAHHVQLID